MITAATNPSSAHAHADGGSARTDAMLARVAADLGPYPHARALDPDAAASCYLGLVESTMARQGLRVPESDVFLFGGAYALRFQQDEYGEPDLWFPLGETTRRFCAALGCDFESTPLSPEHLADQLEVQLADGHGAIAWTFSKHLAYTTDVYASRGYLHSVLLLSIDRARGLVRVLDRQIASTPHVACIAELELAQLERALFEIPWPRHYEEVGSLHRLRSRDRAVASPAQRRAALLATADAVLGSASAVLAFEAGARAWIETGPGEFADRVISSNRVLTTDHVLPSRRALLDSVMRAALPAELEPAVLDAVVRAIRAWENLAAGLRRATRTGHLDRARWDAEFAAVQAREHELWRLVARIV